MNFGKCKICNTATSYEKLPVCEKCENESFKKVKDYIYKKGASAPDEIHHETGVPLPLINHFVENGSLYDAKKELTDEEKREIERRKRLETLGQLKDALSPYENTKSDKDTSTTDKNSGMRFIGTGNRYR